MIVWRQADQAQWQTAADDFARGRLGQARRGPEQHASPEFAALLAELADMGFAALCAHGRVQGLGQGPAALAAVLEPICAVDASAGAAIYANAAAHLALQPLCEAQANEAALAAIAGHWLAWPAFHDLAEQEWPLLGAGNRLSGRAEMLLIGAQANHAVLPARREGAEGMALVLVDLAVPQVQRSAPLRTLGLRATGIVDAAFEQTPVRLQTPLAAEEFDRLQRKLAVPAMAMLCGLMHGSLDTARAYALERYQGGGPISGWGEVRCILSRMQQQLVVAQSLLLQHAEMPAAHDGDESARFALMQVATLACELTDDGIQVLGGNGYMRDYGQEKRLRDARQLQCLGGGFRWRRQRLARAVLDKA